MEEVVNRKEEIALWKASDPVVLLRWRIRRPCYSECVPIDSILSHRLLPDPSPGYIGSLHNAAVAEFIPIGTVLYHKGNSGEFLYVISSGHFLSSGCDTPLGPGELVGLTRNRRETLTAITYAVIRRLPFIELNIPPPMSEDQVPHYSSPNLSYSKCSSVHSGVRNRYALPNWLSLSPPAKVLAKNISRLKSFSTSRALSTLFLSDRTSSSSALLFL